MRVFSISEHGGTLQKNGYGNRNNNQGKHAGVSGPTDDKPLHGKTNTTRGYNRNGKGSEYRKMKCSDKKGRKQPSQHHKLPLGKVDDFGDIVNDIISDGHHRIDDTGRQTADCILQQIRSQ